MSSSWQLFIDTGGTFTDCLAIDPDGRRIVLKVLSSGKVRGTLACSPAGALVLSQPYPVPDGFFVGYRLRSLTTGTDRPEGDAKQTIVSASTAAGEITLGEGVRDFSVEELGAGLAVELHGGEEAPVLAARLITGAGLSESLEGLRLRLATTRGTNALLERKGADTAFFVTRGHGDLLVIGNQSRPDLFALEVRKDPVLYSSVIEVDERLDRTGEVLEPLDTSLLSDRVDSLLDQGYRCAAIALLHSYMAPEHERELASFLVDRGFEYVSVSSELAPLIKILPRAQTAVVDAYLGPVIGEYLGRVERFLDPGALHLMTSSGGLVRSEDFRAKDSLLSGPAGGVVGASAAGRASGLERLLTFDMGGTSTDVARFDRELEYDFEHQVGSASILSPAIAVETVAAGGGSICGFQDGRLKVGPESGGAEPGPACYGRGGPLTLTDVNLLLGRIDVERFQIPIDRAAAEQAALAVQSRAGASVTLEELLEGFLQIANERMSAAIRRISVQRGYDPREYALVSFGGAGGQHACRVAEALNVSTILIPENASLLSALGLHAARFERFAHRQVLEVMRTSRGEGLGSDHESRLGRVVEELSQDARSLVERESVAPEDIVISRVLALVRLAGQDATVEVDLLKPASTPGSQLPRAAVDFGSLLERFDSEYRRTYGYDAPDRPVELESIRVVAASITGVTEARSSDAKEPVVEAEPQGLEPKRATSHLRRTEQVWFGESWREVSVLERTDLAAMPDVAGPCLVTEPHSITVVEPGWTVSVDHTGALELRSAD